MVSWGVMTLAVALAAVIGKTGLGVLRAYYILRVRAGEYQLCFCVVGGSWILGVLESGLPSDAADFVWTPTLLRIQYFRAFVTHVSSSLAYDRS